MDTSQTDRIKARFAAVRERTRIDAASSPVSLIWEMITPERAEQYLVHNTMNRPLRMTYVETLASAIERGEWEETGDPIKVSADGVLLDGQHRLHAIVRAGRGVPMAVARNIRKESFAVIDTGAKRRLSDVLSLQGEPNARNIATILKLLWVFRSTGRFRAPFKNGPSYVQLLELRDQLGDLYPSIQTGRKVNEKLPGATVSLMATLHYLFSEIDPDSAETFFEKLEKGTHLDEDDPILRLRERIFDNRRGVGKRLTPDELGALTIKAWNAFREGRRVRVLIWRAAGPAAESYPRPQ